MRFHFTASDKPMAQQRLTELVATYGQNPIESCDVIVALGGDGKMLKTLKASVNVKRSDNSLENIPVYGMNCGTVGFLMNTYHQDDLIDCINHAEQTIIHPLSMTARTIHGDVHHAHGINEVSISRESHQAVKCSISIDGIQRLPEMVGDGLIISTPAGSTAYNLSAHGPIIPLGSDVLAMTPVSAFRPRRWRGAILPQSSEVHLTMIEPEFRPASAAADGTEVRDVTEVTIKMDNSISYTILSDPGQGLAERAMQEQFLF
ncbi:MAG: NAD kinase [Candidatus Puniceispirillales bacterium]|nr:NAD kinase [Pseudomonadota bacterium]